MICISVLMNSGLLILKLLINMRFKIFYRMNFSKILKKRECQHRAQTEDKFVLFRMDTQFQNSL